MRTSRRDFLGVVAVGAASGLTGPLAGSPQQQPPVVRPHPGLEIESARASESTAWKSIEKGLHASFASPDVSFLRDKVPSITLAHSWRGSAWRGERISAHLLLWAVDGRSQVRLDSGPLKRRGGGEIPAEAISFRFVRYVLSDLPYGSTGGHCGETESDAVSWLPDVLDPTPRFDVAAHSTRPVWLTVDIPADVAPGIYSGRFWIRAKGIKAVPLEFELNVQDAILPPPAEWQFRLDLWQNPWAVAHQHGVTPWSEAHLSLLAPHLRMLANAGAKFITTYIVHSPWKDDTYVADSTMVESIRKTDGGWKFDYSIFDRYVELAMSCGIVDSITCYTMLPWQHRIRFLDQGTGDYVWEHWAPSTSQFRSFWGVFLADLRRHLQSRGWFERTYIGINENPLEDTLEAIRVLKLDSDDWRITYAGKWHSELDQHLDDYCVIVDGEVTPEAILDRKGRGQTTTFYTCCHPPRPNNFVFSPPVENTWMGWHAAALGYDGFLRWAYDSWTADPLRDARHVRWPAGDCFLVYPGRRSSVRFERLREGIADFEKIRVLRRRLSERQLTTAAEKLSSVLSRFSYPESQKGSVAGVVQEGKKLIEELTDLAF